jgi:hypothetical protein
MESIRSANDVAGTSRPKPILSAEGLAVLHAALGRGLVDRDATSSPTLKNALSYICGEAKVKNWPPESLLIAFKTALETVPAVLHLTRGPDRDELIARLVSQCIEEYYGAAPRSSLERDRN